MSKLSHNVINQIKTKHIAPRPRWQYQLLDYSFWLAAILSLLVGSLSFSMIIYCLEVNDWDIYPILNWNLGDYLLFALPYLWILFIVFFTLLTHKLLRYTKSGYSYERYWLVGSNIVLSSLIGNLIFWTNLTPNLSQAMTAILPDPVHELLHTEDRDIKIWNEPERGLLAGEVLDQTGGEVLIRTADDHVWHIIANNAKLSCAPSIQPGSKIKVVGSQDSETRFIGTEIRPWFKPAFNCN